MVKIFKLGTTKFERAPYLRVKIISGIFEYIKICIAAQIQVQLYKRLKRATIVKVIPTYLGYELYTATTATNFTHTATNFTVVEWKWHT